jgi:threonine/homoserine/homoserine lactone efflux protein
MPPGDHLLEFAITAFVLIVVPGPSVLFVVSRGVALGRRAALATVIGNTGGVMVQAVLVALGLGALVERSDAVFTVVKLAGAAYLLVLGLRMLRNRHGLAQLHDATEVPKGTRRIVREGFLVGLTNPKAVIVFTVVLPQFADPARGHVPLQCSCWVGSSSRSGCSRTAPGRSPRARPATGSPARADGWRRSPEPAEWC